MNLTIANLIKTFGDHCVLDAVSLDCKDVRTLALIGPSGGGKSTLLRIIAGLEQPDSGSVTMNDRAVPFADGRKLHDHRCRVGVVFQAFNLFPHLTALENITLPLEKVHRFTSSDARDAAMRCLDRFQLAAHAAKKPAHLSGGQRQRIAIARAIAIKPEVLLFDEPTSALDPEMTAEVLDVIEELREEGRDLILVTHEMGFARQVADQVAFLAEGRVVESSPAAGMFDAPKDPQTRAFLSKVLKY